MIFYTPELTEFSKFSSSRPVAHRNIIFVISFLLLTKAGECGLTKNCFNLPIGRENWILFGDRPNRLIKSSNLLLFQTITYCGKSPSWRTFYSQEPVYLTTAVDFAFRGMAAATTLIPSMKNQRVPSNLVRFNAVEGIPLFFHPCIHGLRWVHAFSHLVHGFDVRGIAILNHFARVLAHHHGNLIKSIGAEFLIAGAAQLAAGHCFDDLWFGPINVTLQIDYASKAGDPGINCILVWAFREEVSVRYFVAYTGLKWLFFSNLKVIPNTR